MSALLTLSNILTILRFPAAFLFLVDSLTVRLIAIGIAMVSDSLDGYVARKRQTVSQFGAILDPIMDKFFAFFALGILVAEGNLIIWQMGALIARDFFLCFFAFYLSLTKGWEEFSFHSVLWGKVTTAGQFLVLIAIVIGIAIPWYVFLLFIGLGLLTFIELFRSLKHQLEDE